MAFRFSVHVHDEREVDVMAFQSASRDSVQNAGRDVSPFFVDDQITDHDGNAEFEVEEEDVSELSCHR
jgi:hypothetical protein